MSDNDLISEIETGQEGVPATDKTPSLLEDLVGEGKKYATPEELAKSRLEADKHIEQIQSENKRMREELAELEKKANSSKTIEDVLKALQTRDSSSTTDNQTGENGVDIASTVKELFDKERGEQTAAQNRAEVNSKVLEYFKGDTAKAKEHMQRALKEAGLNGQTFAQLTNQSPAAALRILNINSSNQSRSNVSMTDRADVNTSYTGGEAVRNMEYYNRLKKEMGVAKFYSDIKLQQQLFKDAEQLGQSFYSK